MTPDETPLSQAEFQALAEFRYRLRQFLHFVEQRARAAGLTPQQVQLLLAIKGAPPEAPPTIATIAERLLIQHHSAVELIDRAAEQQLVHRERLLADRRKVVLTLTKAGEALLRGLASEHHRELRSLGPALVRSLQALTTETRPG